jgi:hypothetical protein
VAAQTLLVILIAMLTISWIAIAVMVILIGTRVIRLLDGVENTVETVRSRLKKFLMVK